MGGGLYPAEIQTAQRVHSESFHATVSLASSNMHNAAITLPCFGCNAGQAGGPIHPQIWLARFLHQFSQPEALPLGPDEGTGAAVCFLSGKKPISSSN